MDCRLLPVRISAAATEAPKLRAAQQGRLRIAQRGGDTQKKIHAILATWLKIWPNDAAVQNEEGLHGYCARQHSRMTKHE